MNAEPTEHIISLGAHVHCSDGYGGSVTRLIVEAPNRRLTHIVVQDRTVPAVEHLVPIAWIAGTTYHRVTLDCTQSTLVALEPFAGEQYISSHASDYEPFYGVDPFAEFEAENIPLVTEAIPPGELAIQRGAQAIASDGPVGEVSAFVVDRASGDISCIVVRLGHWFARHEHAIPIATVERIESGIISLTFTREQIAALPAIQLQ